MADDELPEDADDGEDADRPFPDEGEIRYLNTDLDVRASGDVDLKPLVAGMESRGLYTLTPEQSRQCEDGWFLCFEANTTADEQFREPDPNIAMMLDALESLDATSAELWRACTLRELNIGYDCGNRPWAFNQGISNAVLGRMATAGLTLRVTLYPHPRPDGNPPASPSVAEVGT